MINCPDCNDPQWPIRRPDGVFTGGIRTCGQCRARVIIRKGQAQIKHEVVPEINTQHKRRITQSEYLHAVVNAVDRKILCANCHAETDLVSGMDGRLGSLHGVFCALCLATYPVKTPQDDKRTKRGGIKVTPLSWNNPIQRREADEGILAIARAIEANHNPHDYGVMLAGANWTGLRIRELPAERNQLGAINADYHNAANRPGRIDTSRGSYFVATSNTWFAPEKRKKGQKQGAKWCANRSDNRPRLRAYRPNREVVSNGITLCEVSPTISGIGRDVIAIVSSILTPNRQGAKLPKRTIRHNGLVAVYADGRIMLRVIA